MTPNPPLTMAIVKFLKSDSISRWLASDFSVKKVRKDGNSYVASIANIEDKVTGFAPGVTHELSFWADESLARQLIDEGWFHDKVVRVCFYENKKQEPVASQ